MKHILSVICFFLLSFSIHGNICGDAAVEIINNEELTPLVDQGLVFLVLNEDVNITFDSPKDTFSTRKNANYGRVYPFSMVFGIDLKPDSPNYSRSGYLLKKGHSIPVAGYEYIGKQIKLETPNHPFLKFVAADLNKYIGREALKVTNFLENGYVTICTTVPDPGVLIYSKLLNSPFEIDNKSIDGRDRHTIEENAKPSQNIQYSDISSVIRV